MRLVMWELLDAFWCDCSVWIGQRAARQELRQLERAIREHGVLWLTAWR